LDLDMVNKVDKLELWSIRHGGWCLGSAHLQSRPMAHAWCFEHGWWCCGADLTTEPCMISLRSAHLESVGHLISKRQGMADGERRKNGTLGDETHGAQGFGGSRPEDPTRDVVSRVSSTFQFAPPYTPGISLFGDRVACHAPSTSTSRPQTQHAPLTW
jgi:hypothetical protein